jgi:Protein of unknown function (DUF3551)
MKSLLLPLGVIAAATVPCAPVKAQNYPWGGQYGGAMGGAANREFGTFQQCQATVAGIGGFCIQNNTYQPPSGSLLSTRSRRGYPY